MSNSINCLKHKDTKIYGHVASVFAVALGVLVLAVVTIQPLKLDHDVSYYAAAGRIVAQGQEAYTHYIEANPPGPVLLGQASFLLSEQFGTPFDQTHKYLLLSVQFFALVVALSVLLPLLRTAGSAGWVLVIGLSLSMLLITPETGRREYLGSVAMVPWGLAALLAWNRLRPARPISLLAGALAGTALIVKPHFALIALAVGMFDLVRAGGRPWRLTIETWAALAVSMALYAWFLTTYPAYLSEIVPLARDTFSRLQPGPVSAAASLLDPRLLLALAALAAGLGIMLIMDRNGRWTHPAAGLAAGVGLAAAAMVAVQGFGLHYHRLPLNILVMLCLIGMIAWAIGQAAARSPRRWMLVPALLAAAVLTAERARHFPQTPHRTTVMEHPLTRAMTPETPGAPVLMVSPSVAPAAQILPFLDVRWSGVSAVHWPIPALIRQNGQNGISNPPTEEVRARLESWYRDRILARFEALPPVRVGIDVTPHLRWFARPGFDLLAWLRADPRFDAAWREAGLHPLGDPITYGRRQMQVYVAR